MRNGTPRCTSTSDWRLGRLYCGHAPLDTTTICRFGRMSTFCVMLTKSAPWTRACARPPVQGLDAARPSVVKSRSQQSGQKAIELWLHSVVRENALCLVLYDVLSAVGLHHVRLRRLPFSGLLPCSQASFYDTMSEVISTRLIFCNPGRRGDRGLIDIACQLGCAVTKMTSAECKTACHQILSTPPFSSIYQLLTSIHLSVRPVNMCDSCSIVSGTHAHAYSQSCKRQLCSPIAWSRSL